MSENETNLVHGEKTPDTKPTETVFCTNCGAKNDKINTKCLSCNEDLNKTTQDVIVSTPTSKQSNKQSDISDVLSLVDKNHEYYDRVFSLIDSGLNKFNWCAFFISFPYFLYRKMTKKYILALLGAYFFPYLSIFISIYMGMTFNRKYYFQLKGLVQNPNTSDEVVKQYSGVAPERVWIWVVFILVYMFVIVPMFWANLFSAILG